MLACREEELQPFRRAKLSALSPLLHTCFTNGSAFLICHTHKQVSLCPVTLTIVPPFLSQPGLTSSSLARALQSHAVVWRQESCPCSPVARCSGDDAMLAMPQQCCTHPHRMAAAARPHSTTGLTFPGRFVLICITISLHIINAK